MRPVAACGEDYRMSRRLFRRRSNVAVRNLAGQMMIGGQAEESKEK
jgi:hypothetical protein